MITLARIEEVLRPAGMGWITALRSPQIAELMAERGPWQLPLFDEHGFVGIDSEHYPGERFIVCRNPVLVLERVRKRLELLALTEADLVAIAAATTRARNPLCGQDKIALRVGRIIERYRMAKHFDMTITDTAFIYSMTSQS